MVIDSTKLDIIFSSGFQVYISGSPIIDLIKKCLLPTPDPKPDSEKSFTEGSKDTYLIYELTTPEELSGLLNLELVALRQLDKDGGFRDIPVEEVKRDYEKKSNTVKAFLAEMCHIDLGAPQLQIRTEALYDEYRKYCSQKKERPLDSNVFGKELKKVGIDKDRPRNRGPREYYYLGIQLLSYLRDQNQSLV